MTLDELNAAPQDKAHQALLTCCGSERWAMQISQERPFPSEDALHSRAEEIWRSLASTDWLEAFSKHPKIGETSSSKWSVEEQQGMSRAAHDTATAIRQLNEEYRHRFGYIFIVCAAGKSAEEMRTLLEQRLSHEPELELRIAGGEQAKIMHLRLEKLLQS